jgi:hypothetical protein
MKNVIVILLAVSLSACSVFGGKKTRLVPQAYMPEPPAILMKEPKDLKPIKADKVDTPEEPKS